MASILSSRHYVKGIDLGLGIAGFALNSGTEFLSGVGISHVCARFSDKKWGAHAPAIAAITGKLLAVGTQIAGHRMKGGAGAATFLMSGVFDSFGGAGLALAGAHYYGLNSGRKAAGYQVTRVKTLPAGAEPIHGIGALPPAPDGEGLSWPQLMALSEMH